MWGLELLQHCENFFGTFVLQFAGHLLGGYGILFYHDCAPPTVSLWFLLCPWTQGTFFGGFQHPPINGCSTASCDLGVLTGGGEHTSFYSAILASMSSLARPERGVASAHPQSPNLVTAAGALKVNHHFTVCKISVNLTTLGIYIGGITGYLACCDWLISLK